MFRYERVNFTKKLIVEKIVSLLKKIYKIDGPLKPWSNGPASSRKWTQVELG